MNGWFRNCENCKKDFWVTPGILKRPGRGRFCSKQCWYATKIGVAPWNKGAKGLQSAWNKGRSCDWKEEKHHMWKEFDYGYSAVHNWVRKYKNRKYVCEWCKSTRNIQLANMSHEYKRELGDYKELCAKCHRKYDMQNGWGIIKEIFAK